MRWDVFCKVVDHHGDVGVAWRLAADLAARGESVRFHLDDRRALDWMALVLHTPVVLMTGSASLSARSRTADAILKKPFDVSDLLRVVARYYRP